MTTDTHWRSFAACEGLPRDVLLMFFGEAPGLDTHQQHEQARVYCYTCPVQFDCLYACVENNEKVGIWGGLTESQRKRYLAPELRKGPLTDDVASEIISRCGQRVLRRLNLETPAVA
jgi:WhiB family redox-sensing transcriptional regulator